LLLLIIDVFVSLVVVAGGGGDAVSIDALVLNLAAFRQGTFLWLQFSFFAMLPKFGTQLKFKCSNFEPRYEP
jgi:hypothetical protein